MTFTYSGYIFVQNEVTNSVFVYRDGRFKAYVSCNGPLGEAECLALLRMLQTGVIGGG